MGQQKLVVISLDSLGFTDLAKHQDLMPTVAQLMKRGTWVKRVTGVTPTLTYPSHTSLITGCLPGWHGVVNNTKIQPGRKSPDWFWYQKKSVKVPTLYDLAKKAGLTTAAFLWPVTAGSKIDYNIAEIFPNRIWTNQVAVSLRASSPFFLYQMNKRFGHLRDGIHQPALDKFVAACAAATLEEKKPDLTLVHLVDLDSMRHRFGVESKQAMDALERLDARVKSFVDACRAAGTLSTTNFVILGDHYQHDVTKMIHLNTLLANFNYLTPKKDQTVKGGWKALAKSADGCCYIYTRPGLPLAHLRDLVTGVEGVGQVYSRQEAAKLGADPDCALLVAAKPGYYFTDEAARPAVVEPVSRETLGQPDRYHAVHGYLPTIENYATTALYFGPAIRKGSVVESANLVDAAPTWAKLLGLSFPGHVAGNVIDEIFARGGSSNAL